MINIDGDWYEVWADEGLAPPYLLLLKFDASHAYYEVIDPKEQGDVVFRSSSYEDAKNWLLEDEYIMVRGRMGVDQP